MGEKDTELDELLIADEEGAKGWLDGRELLHTCDCGYVVYDPDEVNEVVQDEFGDSRCEEIYCWACDLSNRFGWCFVETSVTEHGIYHCQSCASSELSLLLDIKQVASGAKPSGKSIESIQPEESSDHRPEEQKYQIFVDESYTPGFPRISGDTYVYAAVIVPEGQVPTVSQGFTEVLKSHFKGTPPIELKYRRFKKYRWRREGIAQGLSEILTKTPGLAIIGLFVPGDGFFNEQIRSLKAQGDCRDVKPTKEEFDDIISPTRMEEAVSKGSERLAFSIAAAVSYYVTSVNGTGQILFDPISASKDASILKRIGDVLPRMPINQILLRRGHALITNWMTEKDPRLEDKVQVSSGPSSKDCRGLQLADFCAGDIRLFFEENAEFLTAAISEELVVNDGVLFPKVFEVKSLNPDLMGKIKAGSGNSFLHLYHSAFAKDMISYYTSNGHRRNLNLMTGDAYDLVD